MEENKETTYKVETRGVNQKTYILTLIGVVVFMVSLFGIYLIVFNQNQNKTLVKLDNTSTSNNSTLSSRELNNSISSSTTATLASVTNATVTSDKNSSASSSKLAYTYITNRGKIITVDYPSDGFVRVLNVDPMNYQFNSISDIGEVSVINNLVEYSMGQRLGYDECDTFKYNKSNPGKLIYNIHDYSTDKLVVKEGTLTLKNYKYYQNQKYGVSMVISDEITGLTENFKKNNIKAVFLDGNTDSDGNYSNCGSETSYTILQTNKSIWVNSLEQVNSIGSTCRATTTADAYKCWEILDRILNSFEYKQ